MSTQISTGATPSSIKRYAAKTAAVLVAVALIAAMTVPVIGTSSGSASANHAPLEAIFGTVVQVKVPDSITVATDSGVRTIIVPDNDVFTGDINAVENITEGDRVVGSIHLGTDGTTTADKLLIVPDLTKPVTRHILGVILEVDGGTIVVQDRDGNTITIDVPSGIEAPPVGTVVTAVAQLDRATGRFTAQAFDRVEDAVQRIQEAKDRVEDADLKDALEERLERARDQHLSALERARQGLERAQQAISAAIAEREEAQRRLDEVQARFDVLREQYVQDANDRNERLPQIRVEGTLHYDADEWTESSGTFSFAPRIKSTEDGVTQAFTWTRDTLAIIPVELRETDPSSPAVTATIARSIALPLNDVKSLIPSGSLVTVQYDPNAKPPLATLLTVLPPKLPDAIEDALAQERLRSINGFVTLVDETPDLNTTIGVIVVANRQHDLKFAVKVTAETQVEIDGQLARFGQLAAGMSVEVEFDAATAGASVAVTSLTGRLNALRIRANSIVDNDEVYVAGVIAGLDQETRTVGILTREGEIVRAQVVDEAVIVKNEVQSRFSALEVGDLVLDATRFKRDTLVLTRLAVQSPRPVALSGTITSLDHNPDRLTITAANGGAFTVFIVSSSQIRTESGTSVRFSALSDGDKVLKGEAFLLQQDGRIVLVATELVVGSSNISSARGIVSRADADSGKIRIDTQPDSSGAGSRKLDLTVAENNRSVIFRNDVRIRDLSPVSPGDIIESVSYITATGTIVKMSIVSPNLHRARGFVNAVTNNGITVQTSNGLTVGIAVTNDTVVTLNGKRITSMKLISRGDIVVEAVYIAGKDNPANGVGLKITLITPLPAPGASVPPGSNPDGSQAEAAPVETTISGVIQEISGSTWKIGDRKFTINANTRFFGERPQKGLVAKATLVLERGGGFVAIAISVAGRPDTNPTTRPVEIQPVEPGDGPDLVRILGKVQVFELGQDGRLAIVVIDGVNVVLVSDTVIAGEPKIGGSALAVVRRTPGGSVVANSIIFIRARDSASDEPDADTDSDEKEQPEVRPVRPTATPTPKPAEDHDDPNVPSDDDTAAVDTDSDVKIETIKVERFSGRVVIADGKTYLLKPAEAIGLRVGATITLKVREVERENVSTELSIVDRLALTGNPLYQETSKAGESKLFVAE